MTPEERIKSVAPIAAAILPDSTPLERALLSVELAALADVDPGLIATIWDPWKCPVILLPWLAWAASVDIWSDDWSEIEKRREIALSPNLHRLKGTVWAVKAAVERLGLAFDLTEWWERVPAGRHGTFSVFVDVTGVTDTAPLRAEASARIRTSKPKSRVGELRLGVSEAGPIGIAAATLTTTTIAAEPFVLDGNLEEPGPLGIAAATWTTSTIIAEPRA